MAIRGIPKGWSPGGINQNVQPENTGLSEAAVKAEMVRLGEGGGRPVNAKQTPEQDTAERAATDALANKLFNQ